MDLSIVVLAAGQGTRMKSTLPKVLHPIAGKPMLAHVIKTAQSLTPKKIVVVHGFGGEILKESFSDTALEWAHQPKQLGTGDAVAKALAALNTNERVLILYGDVPLISAKTLQQLLEATPDNAMGLITSIMDDPYGLGRIIRDDKGHVIKVVEQKDASTQELKVREANTGIYVVPVKYLKDWIPQLSNDNHQKEYYLTDIIAMAVKDKVAISTVNPSHHWEVLGINDRQQQSEAERYYQRALAKTLMKEGVTICDPLRFDVRGTLNAKNDVVIDVNAIFEGDVTLGSGCKIGPNCILINCRLGDNVTLLANCHLENATIGNNVTIGPFARLRPGTVLADEVRVGNFVEVKNTQVGKGSKINHLSYIGDTVMGANVNVGAGTITCNYDGVNKHQTIIEDDVMIGSDTQLIAPVRIEKGATIGAGSTVNKDAPANQLTLTQQLNQRSKNWERPKKSTKNNNSF